MGTIDQICATWLQLLYASCQTAIWICSSRIFRKLAEFPPSNWPSRSKNTLVCSPIEAIMVSNELQIVEMELLQMLTKTTVQHHSNFKAYLDDLPDAGQDLFLQTGDVLDKFTWFPLLPAELRLKICGCILLPEANVTLTTAGRFSCLPPCITPFSINYEHEFLQDQSDFQWNRKKYANIPSLL